MAFYSILAYQSFLYDIFVEGQALVHVTFRLIKKFVKIYVPIYLF